MKYFNIEQQITEQLLDDFTNFLMNAAEDIEVKLKSLGGIPHVGKQIYDLLKIFPYQTTVYSYDYVDSAAVLVFLGFKKRYATRNTTLLIHPTTTSRDNLPETVNRYVLENASNFLKSADELFIDAISAETNLDKELILKMMILNKRFSAEQLLEYGFIQKLV